MLQRSKIYIGFIGLVFLLSSFSFSEPVWKKQLEALSSNDRIVLEKFFRIFLRDSQGGFVLFGNKPVCSEGILPSEQSHLLMLGSELHERNIVFKEGLKVWRKLPLKSDHYFVHVYNKPTYQWQEILLVNRGQVLKVIQENLPLFQYVLGPMVTPEEFFQKMMDPEESLGSIFKEDRVLIGVILGFGVQNSLFISRMENIDELLEQREKIPFKSIKQEKKSKKKGFFQKHFSQTYPGFGFSNLTDELAHLGDQAEVSKELVKTSSPQIPWFGCLKSKETEKLLSDYRKAQKQIHEILNSNRFLERVFSQIFGDCEATTILPVMCEEEEDQVDFSSIIAQSIYSDLDDPDVELDPFIQGMLTYKKGASSVSEKWRDLHLELLAAKRLLQAKKNLSEAEIFFENFGIETTCLVPSKLYYRKIKEGNGKIVQNSDALVKIGYTVSNLKGEINSISEVESTYLSSLISGCMFGMRGMAIGEEREIWIHPSYGYGETANIAPNLGLVIKIKLIDLLHEGSQGYFCENPFQLATEQLNAIDLQNNLYDLTKRLAFSIGSKTWAHYEKGQKERYSLDAVIAALRKLQAGETISSIPLAKADELLVRLHGIIYQAKNS